jgi:ParB/RepB/Spo0J family partition protein
MAIEETTEPLDQDAVVPEVAETPAPLPAAADGDFITALDLPAAPRPPIDEREIAIDDIAFRANIRPAYHGIELLAETMHLQGQLQPCVVRPTPDAEHGKPFELIFGHRRKAAAEYLGWNTLRCEVREIADDQTITQMIVENFQREDLSPVAEARAMYALKNSTEPPMANAEVARALGCDPSHVSHRLKLLSLGAPPPQPAAEPTPVSIQPDQDQEEDASGSTPPPKTESVAGTPAETTAETTAGTTAETASAQAAEAEPAPIEADNQLDILQLVDEGKISASTAEVIASLEDDDDRQKLTEIVIRNDWGVKKAAKWARDVKINKQQLDEGAEAMGPVEMVNMADVTSLQRLNLRPDLSDAEYARVLVYALLRNGMDQEMLDFLYERMGYPYENLWDYVSLLDDEQVALLTRRLAVRYVTAAHRWFDLEATLKDSLGLPESAAEQEQLDAVEQTRLSLPGILQEDISQAALPAAETEDSTDD